MGQKKETLLRWVNCCWETEAIVDKLRNLSDGAFFLHILGFLGSHYTTNSAPWLQIVTILRDHNITDEIIDFDGAASGNEDELAKLVVVCMHLTMVQKPCEMIKQKTMINLSTEDQKVLESILTALVNDDSVTRSRLAEVIQDSGNESSLSKPMTFYTSSPLSSMPRNSPLKRFLDSPMALRLSRLQREINDKNEEIRRLQSEIITESDESSALRNQMEELNRRVKEMEKRNAELTQRLRDCQIPDSTLPGADIEINQLKKQLKKLQSEYELSCQKYCDLNLEHEALKTRQEKDRKQIRQLQVELNEAVARFERESAEYQLLLDSIRTENVELKHTLEEKSQWIDVLEERNRNSSESHRSRLMSTPKSPCERESIGFSLLSIETEKLQFEVDTYKRELLSQASNFEAERLHYQHQVGSLQQEKANLSRQIDETSTANATLHTELQDAKTCLEQLTQGCNSLRQEKDSLLVSLESLNEEFQRQMERAQHQLEVRESEAQHLGAQIESLNGELGQALEQKAALQQSIETLEKEKFEVGEMLASLKQANELLESNLAAKELEYKRHIGDATSKIHDLQEKVLSLENSTSHLQQERSNLILEKEHLEAEVRDLRSEIERSTLDFQSRLDSANSSLEEASSRITELTSCTSLLQNQLEEALKGKAHFEKLSADLEAQRTELFAEREALQQEVSNLLASAQLSRDEFMTEKNQLLEELDVKKKDIADKLSTIDIAEKRHEEAVERIERLESSVRALENDMKELLESKNYFEQQALSLQAEVDDKKHQLEAIHNEAKVEAANYESQISQCKAEIQTLETQMQSILREKKDFEEQVILLGNANDAHQQQVAFLRQAGEELHAVKRELESRLHSLEEELQQSNEKRQSSIREQSDKICLLEEKLLQSVQKQNDLSSRLGDVTDEKLRLVEEKESLAAEASRLVSSLEQAKVTFEATLTAMKNELVEKQAVIDEANQKISAIECELAQINAQKSALENQIQLMAAEHRELLEQQSSLEQANLQLDALKKQQQEENDNLLQRLKSEHDERILQLTQQLEDAQQRSIELSSKCVQLECEREALSFEKINFEQMYLEVKSACDEAEAKILLESELARKDAEAKESKIQQQSEALFNLQATVDNLRQEREMVENTKARRICELEEELKTMQHNRDHLERERSALASSSDASLKQLEERLSSITKQLEEQSDNMEKTDALRRQAEEQRDFLVTELNELKLSAQTEAVARTQLSQQVAELKNAQASAQQTYDEEINRLHMEVAIKQQQLDQERETLRGTEEGLQNSNQSIQHLEVFVEQLTADIQELSSKKANLEELNECLESAKAAVEEEVFQLREELQAKDLQLTKLSEKIKSVEHQLDQTRQENQSLLSRIDDLETKKQDTVLTLEKQLHECELTLERSASALTAEKERAAQAQTDFLKALSDLRSSSDGNRRELEASISVLKRDLEAEQQKSYEQAGSIRELKATRQEMSDLVESLQRQLTEIEAEKETLRQVKTELEEESKKLREENESQKTEFEQTNENLQATLAELNIKLDCSLKMYGDLKAEHELLKDNHEKCIEEKASLERLKLSSEDELKSLTSRLQSKINDLEGELKLKAAEIGTLSEAVGNLKVEVEQAQKKKRAVEEEMNGQLSTLTLEKENLQKKQTLLEQENRQLKADFLAEKDKSSQTKGETTLEHRKEKAALEARLQLAQAQVKSMQEKLVDMTVANNSHAPLEHKISLLTSELEAATKAKEDMEKKLKEATERMNGNKASVGNEEQQADSQEFDVLLKKYETIRKTLIHKEEVISQYAKKFEKMQTQLDGHDEQVSSLTAENRKLSFENRTLKTEQQHLLAQIAAEKDKANAKASRHSLALQRGLATSDGGTLADVMVDARRRTLRSTKSEVVSSSGRRSPDGEVFRPPSLAFGDGSDASSIFKVPPSRRDSFNRRDSVNSVCSTRSDASTASRLPHGAGRFFTCDDEDGEQFSNLYLNEMKEGKCKVEDVNARLSELHRRNTLQLPHMRSAYPVEANDERLRCPDLPAVEPKIENMNETVNQLSEATSMLSVHTPPAMNTRKRRSSSWNMSGMETPVMQPSKRRSQEDANMSIDSGHSTNRSILSSAERRKHRDASQTTYQRPGPPTPGKNTLKESNSILSNNSSPKMTPKQAKQSAKTPNQPSRSAKLTPGALVRRVQAKIRSNKQLANENTPSRDTTPRSNKKLNIFRKPLGSRGSSSVTEAKF